MSHIPFHKWGKQNNNQTQNLINNVTLGSSASQNRMIKPGEALFYSYQNGTYTYVENSRYSAGNWGCFKDSTSIELLANTNSILSRRWLQAKGATDGRVNEGTAGPIGNNVINNRYWAIGVSINSNNTGSASDSIAVQVSGVAQISWDDTLSGVDVGEFITTSNSTDGEVVSGGSGSTGGDMGILVNGSNVSANNSGYVWVKLNLVELW